MRLSGKVVTEMSNSMMNKEIVLKILENNSVINKEKPKVKESIVRSFWIKASKIFTFAFPEKYVPGNTEPAKIAWREKLMLCMIIFAISVLVLGYLMWLPESMCPASNVMSLHELSKKPSYSPHVVIHGKVYDFTDLAQKHSRNLAIPHHIYDFAGKDASFLFPRYVYFDSINSHRKQVLDNMDVSAMNFKPEFHSFQALQVASNWQTSYDLCFSQEEISKSSLSDSAWIILNNEVFNISSLRNELALITAKGNIEPELLLIMHDENFNKLIDAPWGRDKSNQFKYTESESHYNLLLKGYVIGVVDYRESFQCKTSNFLMIFSTGIVVLIILVKFLASMQLGIKNEPEKLNRCVAVLISCYCEDEDSLKASISSVANLDYDNRKKVIVIVSDGNVTGQKNTTSTPDILKKILGIDESRDTFAYQSVSSEFNDLNRAEIYFGHYETEDRLVPFILIIKVGCFHDPSDNGNRGKRDSQLILLKFFSKIFYNHPLNPLDIELFSGFLKNFEINPLTIEFILMVDADTELFSDSLNRLLACCVHDSRIIGICGETRIKNETTSWITMIQVYEYFISHHMSKSFESLFGCVTCLPGCFCMYRLKNVNDKVPLLIRRELIDEYSQTDVYTLHQKNLLSLGEDRYLTTLALKHFPSYRTKFTPDAICKTVVPDSWSVLLSQRRRWINSTIHNLLELLLLKNLCGFCIFSMRFIIFMDLFSTVILPSTVIYMMYLMSKTIQDHFTAKMSLFMICSVYGLQVLVFMLKKQWQHIGWMIIYILALPLFGLFIPIYSFWHFDDFSWGDTRRLKNDDYTNEENGVSKPSEPLVLKTWDEYLVETDLDLPLGPIGCFSPENK